LTIKHLREKPVHKKTPLSGGMELLPLVMITVVDVLRLPKLEDKIVEFRRRVLDLGKRSNTLWQWRRHRDILRGGQALKGGKFDISDAVGVSGAGE